MTSPCDDFSKEKYLAGTGSDLWTLTFFVSTSLSRFYPLICSDYHQEAGGRLYLNRDNGQGTNKTRFNPNGYDQQWWVKVQEQVEFSLSLSLLLTLFLSIPPALSVFLSISSCLTLSLYSSLLFISLVHTIGLCLYLCLSPSLSLLSLSYSFFFSFSLSLSLFEMTSPFPMMKGLIFICIFAKSTAPTFK